MDKQSLQNLGRMLVEDKTISNFDGLVESIKNQFRRVDEVVVTVRKFKRDGVPMRNMVTFSFDKTSVTEEAIPVKMASDVWKDNKDKAKTYISNTVYYVKEDGDKFVVTTITDNKRKTFATLSKVELDKSFTPMRATETADAEGYKTYRDVDEVSAFNLGGDPVKVEVENGSQQLLNTGDYLVRKATDNNFTYEIRKSKDFETLYSPKK